MAASEMTAAVETQDQARVGGSDVSASVVVCLGPAYQDSTPERLEPLLALLEKAVAGSGTARMLIGYPASHGEIPASDAGMFTLLPFVQSVSAHTLAVQPAATWLSAFEFMRAHGSTCCLLLGAEAHTLPPEALRMMLDAVLAQGVDLAIPRYTLQPNQGLLNAAMISPLSAAVFGVEVAFPLALDYALSFRMAERMASMAQRFTAAAQGDALLWPASEAAVAGFTVAEIATAYRELPQPQEDLSAILGLVGGSLFSDVEAKATFWQRTRPATQVTSLGDASRRPAAMAEPPSAEEIDELIQSFRIGYSNLHEIWSLVLPPNTLLGLKRLSQMPAGTFALPNNLWARIVYDFVLAHRLRTISRGHLLGALTPLYLAWVASHIVASSAPSEPGSLLRAFEADKPYLVSRWRWPDRFNP